MKRICELPESPRQQLDSYTLAATAAGVSLLALVPSAEGRIVYTAAHVTISRSNPLVQLNLNHGQNNQFEIAYHMQSTGHGELEALAVLPVSQKDQVWVGNTYLVSTGKSLFAAPLPAGARIGHNSPHFQPGGQPMGSLRKCSTGFAWEDHETPAAAPPPCYNSGPWLNKTNLYLGLQFQIQGKLHYGWARMSVKILSDNSCSPYTNCLIATLTGYAYETVPNKPIIAGKMKESNVVTLEPASLGHLAQGSSGLSAWHKTNPVTATH